MHDKKHILQVFAISKYSMYVTRNRSVTCVCWQNYITL